MKRIKRKRRMNWRCTCGHECRTKDELIAHYRREHPDNPYGLWDIVGDLGDDFANGAMKALEEKNQHSLQHFHEAQTTAKAYDELKDRHASLIHAVRMGAEALEMYKDRFEKVGAKQSLQGETK